MYGKGWNGKGSGGGKGGWGGEEMMMQMMMMLAKGKGKGGGWQGEEDYGDGKRGSKRKHRAGASRGSGISDETIAAIDIEEATSDEVQAFVDEHACEAHAVTKFKNLNPKLQKIVINQGSMADAKDQTAVLMSRVRRIVDLKPGDWFCPKCSDIVFGKNDACRKCGEERSEEQKLANAERIGNLKVQEATHEEVLAFLSENSSCEAHAVEKFQALDPKIQKIIMKQGTMGDARDPTAVLMSRIRRANEIRPGDWVCSNCADLQFAKNDKCRKCGAAKS